MIALQVGRRRKSPVCITQPPDSSWLEHTVCLEKNHPGAHPGCAPSQVGHYSHPRDPSTRAVRVDLAQKYLFFPHFSSPLLIQLESTFWKPSKLDFWISHWYRSKNVSDALSDILGFLRTFSDWDKQRIDEGAVPAGPSVTGTVAGPSRSLFAPWCCSAWTWRECSWDSVMKNEWVTGL